MELSAKLWSVEEGSVLEFQKQQFRMLCFRTGTIIKLTLTWKRLEKMFTCCFAHYKKFWNHLKKFLIFPVRMQLGELRQCLLTFSQLDCTEFHFHWKQVKCKKHFSMARTGIPLQVDGYYRSFSRFFYQWIILLNGRASY